MPLISRNWMRTWSMMKGRVNLISKMKTSLLWIQSVRHGVLFSHAGSVAPEEKYQGPKQSLTNSHSD